MSHSETPTKSAEWRWLREQGVKTMSTLDPMRLILESLVSRGSFGFRSTVGGLSTDTEAEKFLKYVQRSEHGHVHLPIWRLIVSDDACTGQLCLDGQSMEAALAEAHLLNGDNELSLHRWLRNWAANHAPGSHRRK